jgi:hypothetical protein
VLFIIYCLGLAVGPRVPNDEQRLYCVKNINLPGPFGISLNCDSPVFLEDAANPRLLLAENAVYQGRPLHISLVGLIGYPLRLATTPVIRMLNLDEKLGFGLDLIGKENPYRDTTFDSESDVAAGIVLFIPYFIAYFLVDMLLLAGTFGLYVRLVQPEDSWRGASMAVLLVGLLLVFNDLTKAFLLSPHSQMFNLFVPLYSLFAFLQLSTAPSRRRVISLAGLSGLGILAYAYFAIAVPVAILALLVHWVPKRGWWAALRHIVVDSLILVGLAALPMLLWVGFVIARNGTFFSFEVACCRQIVWMGDALAAGGPGALLRQFSTKVAFFGRQGLTLSVIPILTGILIGLLGASGRRNWRFRARDRLLLSGMVCVSGVSVLFLSFLGYTVPRLATGSMVPLLIGIGLLAREATDGLDTKSRWWMDLGMLIAITAVVIYILVKPGPYS